VLSTLVSFKRLADRLLATLLLTAVALGAGLAGRAQQQAARLAACRFGITAPYGVADYDLAGLGAGSYLDWGMQADPPRPGGLAYVQVVRLGDLVYAEQLAGVPAVAAAQPGSAWLVGNEPDNTYTFDGVGQDNLAPEVYAERYQAVYAAIKAADPQARVGMGGIVQPTPVRLEYLDRVLTAYQDRYGSPPPADFWFVHAFVLNEAPGEWGAGLPVDAVVRPYQAAPEVIAPEEVDSLAIFARRLVAMRAWLAAHGQRELPLWVTEYGVLMPSDARLGYFAISTERTQAFMLDSFDYFQRATNAATGLSADGDRLVQRWYWWTLSYDPRVSGGGLYDRSGPVPVKTALYDAYAAASDCH